MDINRSLELTLRQIRQLGGMDRNDTAVRLAALDACEAEIAKQREAIGAEAAANLAALTGQTDDNAETLQTGEG